MLAISLYWRLMLMIMLLGLGVGTLLDKLFISNLSETLHWKPTILWWLIGIVFWLFGAISASRLALLLIAKHLSIAVSAWYQLSNQLAITFMVLGILNPMIFSVSNHAWLTYKLLAVPVGLMIVVMIFTRQVQRVE